MGLPCPRLHQIGAIADASASTASAKARAIITGIAGLAIAVFVSTASKPSSIAAAAWEGAPIPASMISGTFGKCARQRFQTIGVVRPRPEPMGDPHGIRNFAARPKQLFRRDEILGSGRENLKPFARENRCRLDETENISACKLSSSPMTSSLTQEVSKTSRAICAVVTASLTLRHPAVLGRTRTPRSRISARTVHRPGRPRIRA